MEGRAGIVNQYFEVRYSYDRWSRDDQVGYGKTFDEALEDASITVEDLLKPRTQYTMQWVTWWEDEEGTHISRKTWLSRRRKWI